MPPVRMWFAAFAGFITGAVGALSTVQVQLSGTPQGVTVMAWLTIVGAGLLSAVAAGKAAWPQMPPPSVPPFGTRQTQRESHHG